MFFYRLYETTSCLQLCKKHYNINVRHFAKSLSCAFCTENCLIYCASQANLIKERLKSTYYM